MSKSIDGLLEIQASDIIISDSTSISDGTVSNPSLKFTLDPDTGIFRKGVNDLAIVSGGNEIISFSDSSNITTTRLITTTAAIDTPLLQSSSTMAINIAGVNVISIAAGSVTIQQELVIDRDDSTALVVRKNGGGLTVLGVDTINSVTSVNGSFVRLNALRVQFLNVNAVQSIPNSTNTIVNLPTVGVNNSHASGGGLFTFSSNRFTNVSGSPQGYFIRAFSHFAGDGIGTRSLYFPPKNISASTINSERLEGVSIHVRTNTDSTDGERVSVEAFIELNNNDWFELGCLQSSGGNLDISFATASRYDIYSSLLIIGL